MYCKNPAYVYVCSTGKGCLKGDFRIHLGIELPTPLSQTFELSGGIPVPEEGKVAFSLEHVSDDAHLFVSVDANVRSEVEVDGFREDPLRNFLHWVSERPGHMAEVHSWSRRWKASCLDEHGCSCCMLGFDFCEGKAFLILLFRIQSIVGICS